MNWNSDSIRTLERASIRDFMTRHQDLLLGRVLDFGSGREPYRDLVKGEYSAYDSSSGAGARFMQAFLVRQMAGYFDTIMCNQVIQYIERPRDLMADFARWLKPDGMLVMTYPTSWDEVETSDFWRFTKSGMTLLLVNAGFEIIAHERRAAVELGGFNFPLGYGVVARRRI